MYYKYLWLFVIFLIEELSHIANSVLRFGVKTSAGIHHTIKKIKYFSPEITIRGKEQVKNVDSKSGEVVWCKKF